jgi:hypothetical protein
LYLRLPSPLRRKGRGTPERMPRTKRESQRTRMQSESSAIELPTLVTNRHANSLLHHLCRRINTFIYRMKALHFEKSLHLNYYKLQVKFKLDFKFLARPPARHANTNSQP